MIPLSNAEDLVLNDEVEKEIKNGNFHIYTMTSIDDAIQVLMGDSEENFETVMVAINKEIKKYSSSRR